MTSRTPGLWRGAFIVSSLCVLAGGPQHPGGPMAQMLADPKWIPAHSLLLAGFVALLIGLLLFRQSTVLPPRTAWWVWWAIVGTSLQVIEMALHTIAFVDQANLVTGRSTPILTVHLTLATLFYPIFGITIIGFIWAGMRDGVVGSRWIGWLGILGAAAHGASAPLVVAAQIEGASSLFKLLVLLALWLLLAGIWPARTASTKAA